jgi:hypothetical protein
MDAFMRRRRSTGPAADEPFGGVTLGDWHLVGHPVTVVWVATVDRPVDRFRYWALAMAMP